ncbi:unnamed protein product [Mytilus coruscus]|uniref:Tesmin/TSO1-like CXC domain-containing protein n=1 Tax=Mytilus coruscus TaxID=42192 RepID=A0A6J8CGN1_MYTCO|nr:unnamed protein product [Mytilus coruscus]
MLNLPATHPALDNLFKTGHHVIRRTDRFWAGLPTDLVIGQALMRSLKTTGGLTTGRGLSESQRLQWLLSMPQCSEMNEAMQKLTDVNYNTSEQHKELGKSSERSPFSFDITFSRLRNIETGTIADGKVNVDRSVKIGKDILKYMEEQNADDFVFKKSKQVVTLASKTNIKIDGEEVIVDPQFLFQRLVAASNNIFPDIAEIFKFELSSTPAALFEPSGLMRQAQKATLADALWNIGDCAVHRKLDSELHYVIDGALPFLSSCSSVEDIVNCSVQIIAYLYGGVPHESRDIIRYRKFANKVLSNSVTFLQVRTLPPTSAAAEQHCKRVFYQIIEWTEEKNLNPLDWGWSITNDRLTPIKTTLSTAPDKLLNIIRYKCKTNCDTRRCTCRKHELECTIACTECNGQICTNAEKLILEEDQKEENDY